MPMRKIKQTERPFVIRYLRGERRLFDSAATLEIARAKVAARLAKHKRETATVSCSGQVVLTLGG